MTQDYSGAIAIGRRGLQELGMGLPDPIGPAEIAAEATIVRGELGDREPRALAAENAQHDPVTAQDPVVERRGLKSIVCMPLGGPAGLVGVLYLENNLMCGAFGPERTELLRLLATPIAVSLSNAELYTDLEDLYNRAPCGYHSLDAGKAKAKGKTKGEAKAKARTSAKAKGSRGQQWWWRGQASRSPGGAPHRPGGAELAGARPQEAREQSASVTTPRQLMPRT